MRKRSETGWAWGLIAALFCADLLGFALTGMTLRPMPCVVEVAAIVGLLMISRIYATARNEPRLSTLALTGAQLLAYVTAAGILSYLLTVDGRPTIDGWLVAADRSLGFDWMAMYAWGKAHVFAHLVLILAYYSLIPQLVLVQVVLFAGKRFEQARELFWLFILTSLGCVLVSGVFPAQGAFITFHVSMDNPYVEQFLGLRSGDLKVIDVQHMQGVVQFPSFHLAMAVILAYAARGVPVLFPLLLVVNTVVILATPLVGGHHLTDLAGGTVLTLAAIGLVRRTQKTRFTFCARHHSASGTI